MISHRSTAKHDMNTVVCNDFCNVKIKINLVTMVIKVYIMYKYSLCTSQRTQCAPFERPIG